MSELENSISESYNSKTSELTRTQIYNIRSGTAETKEREKKQKLANYNIYGNGKYTQTGSTDRMLGRVSRTLFELDSEGDLKSYFYGYYIKGNNNLKLYCNGIIPDYIDKRELLGIVGFDPDEEITEDKIQTAINRILIKVGYEDSQNESIIYDELPEILKNNQYYNYGYYEIAKQSNIKNKK